MRRLTRSAGGGAESRADGPTAAYAVKAGPLAVVEARQGCSLPLGSGGDGGVRPAWSAEGVDVVIRIRPMRAEIGVGAFADFPPFSSELASMIPTAAPGPDRSQWSWAGEKSLCGCCRRQ